MADPSTPIASTDPEELQRQAQRNWQLVKQEQDTPTAPAASHPWLAQLRAKFPGQYDHLDDATLAQNLAKNDPQYQWLADEVGGAQRPGAIPPELKQEVQQEYQQAPDVDETYMLLDAFKGALSGFPNPANMAIRAVTEGLRSYGTQKLGAMGARGGAGVAKALGGGPTAQTVGAVTGSLAAPMSVGAGEARVMKAIRSEPELATGAFAAKKAAGERAAEVPGELQPHQDRFAAKVEEIHADAADELRKTQERLEKEATAPAQAEAIKAGTPPSPPTALEPGTALPTQETAAREAETYGNLTNPIQRTADAWAEKRNALLGDYMDQQLDAQAVTNAVEGQEQWLAANNRAVSGPVRKLMQATKELVQPAGGVSEGALGYSPAELAAKYPDLASKIGTAEFEQPNVRKLLGLQSQAKLLGRTLKSPTDRAVAHSISDAIDEALASIDVPNLRPLNAQYWAFRNRFPGNFSLLMANPSNIQGTAKQVFDDARRAQGLINAATPEELTTLRRLYGQAAQENPHFIKPEHQQAVNALFKGTPLQTPEGFSRLMANELNLEQMLELSPQVGQRVEELMMEHAQAMQSEIANQIARDAVTEARKMGPLGERIVERINAATTPMQRAQVATEQMSGASLEEAQQLAIANMKRDLTTKGGEQIPKPTTPDEAALAAIRTGQEPKAGRMAWVMTRLPLYTAMVAFGAMTGRKSLSPYIGGMAALGATMRGTQLLRRAFLRSMEDPQKAQAFWNAINEPSKPGALNVITRQMMIGLSKSAPFGLGAAVEKAPAAAETDLEQSSKQSPVEKEYYRTSAQQTLGGPDAHAEDVKAVAKTHQQLQSGKTPDVQQQLRSGQLSIPAIKETMVKVSGTPVTPRNAQTILDNVGPDDAMHMLQMASPQERQWLEPLVRQKLQQAMANPQTAPWMKQQVQSMLTLLPQQ